MEKTAIIRRLESINDDVEELNITIVDDLKDKIIEISERLKELLKDLKDV